MGSNGFGGFELRNHFAAVVKDLDRTAHLWSSMLKPLGISPWQIKDIAAKRDDVKMIKPFRVKVAVATLEALGSLQLELVEEIRGGMIWSQFYKKHGEGWHHVEMFVSNFDEAVSGFQKHGGKMILGGGSPMAKRSCCFEIQPSGPIFVIMEQCNRRTEKESVDMTSMAGDEIKVGNHFCAVVEDVERTAQLWSSILAPLGIRHWEMVDLTCGEEELTVGSPFKLKIGVTTLEAVDSLQLELIEPVEGNSIWSQFLKNHGEGWQHLEFLVPNYDEVVSNVAINGGRITTAGYSFGRRWCYFEPVPGGPAYALAERLL